MREERGQGRRREREFVLCPRKKVGDYASIYFAIYAVNARVVAVTRITAQRVPGGNRKVNRRRSSASLRR